MIKCIAVSLRNKSENENGITDYLKSSKIINNFSENLKLLCEKTILCQKLLLDLNACRIESKFSKEKRKNI